MRGGVGRVVWAVLVTAVVVASAIALTSGGGVPSSGAHAARSPADSAPLRSSSARGGEAIAGPIRGGGQLPPAVNISLGRAIVASLFDPLNGYVYELGGNYRAPSPGTLTAINPSGNQTVANITVGIAPYAVALNPANGYLFVANFASNNVTIINGATNEAVESTSIAGGPDGVAYDPATGNVYVANVLSSNVSVINGTTGADLGISIPLGVGADPYSIGYDPATGLLYTANFGDDSVNVINATLDEVVHTIPVGAGPYFVVTDVPNGNVYVLNNDSGNVSVIDGATSTVIASVGIDPNAGSGPSTAQPQGAAYDTRNQYLYVANYGAGTISALNTTTTRTDVYSIGVGGGPDTVAYAPTEGSVFVGAASSGNVSVYPDDALPGLPATLAVGNSPSVLSYSPTDRETLVLNSGGASVSILNDLNLSVAVPTLGLGVDPSGVAYSAYNDSFYVTSSESSGIFQIAAANHSLLGQPLSAGDPSTNGTPVVDAANGSSLYAVSSLGNFLTFDLTTNALVGVQPTNLTGPTAILSDPANGYAYVTGSNATEPSTQLVEIIDENTGAVVANVSASLSGQLRQLAYDPLTGDVYVPAINGLLVLNGTQQVAEIALPSTAYGVAVDTSTGLLYVTLQGYASLMAVDPVRGIAIPSAPVALPQPASGISYDPLTQTLYASLTGGLDEIGIVSADNYEVGFSINGSGGNYWSITFDNFRDFATNSSFFPYLSANGTFTFSISPPEGLLAIPDVGDVNVFGSNETVNVSFVTPYTVYFQESGLPAGTNWGLTIGETTYTSENTYLTVDLPNGTYDYTLLPVPGYTLPIYEGSFRVDGSAPPAINVSFSLFYFVVPFTEYGLPVGSSWYVNFTSVPVGAEVSNLVSTTPTADALVANGSFTFSQQAYSSIYFVPSGFYQSVVLGIGSTVAIDFTLYNSTLTYQENGLPSGTPWTVTQDGIPIGSTEGQVVFGAPNGTHDYVVANASGYVPSPPTGSVLVVGEPVTVYIQFAPGPSTEYPVTFSETGLPTGTYWSVTVNGSTQGSNTPSFVLDLPNGSYTWSANEVPNFTPRPPSGPVVVAGGPASVEITYTSSTPGQYAVTFTESGLPAEATWGANLGLMSGQSNGTSILFYTGNGSYPWNVPTVDGYRAVPASGTLVVLGGPVAQTIRFTNAPPVTYSVTFDERGLPGGTSWSATFNGTTRTTSATSIAFVTSNGTFSYALSASLANYVVFPPTGSISVSGVNTTIVAAYAYGYRVTFTESGLPSGTLWSVSVTGPPTNGSAGSASATFNSTLASFGVYLPNGTYTYAISTSVSGWEPSTPTGSVVVAGSSPSAVTTAFLRGYLIVVEEVGLPNGTTWQLGVNGTTYSSSTPFITFYLPNGNYTATFASVGSYVPAYASVPFSVQGSGSTFTFTYAIPAPAASSGSSTLTFFGLAWWLWAILAAILIAVATIGAELRDRRRSRKSSPPAPEAQSPPASPPPPA